MTDKTICQLHGERYHIMAWTSMALGLVASAMEASQLKGAALLLPSLAILAHISGPLRDYIFVKDFPKYALRQRLTAEESGRRLRRGQIFNYVASAALGWSCNVMTAVVIAAEKAPCVAGAENSCLQSTDHARHQSHPREPRRL